MNKEFIKSVNKTIRETRPFFYQIKFAIGFALET